MTFAGISSASVVNVYVAQSTAGAGDGSSCSNAKAVNYFNSSANWGSGASQIGAGTTVHLCGTLTSTISFQGSGASGSPITLLFESGAKFSKPTWGTTTIITTGGTSSWLVVDGGANGLIENTNNGSSPTYPTKDDTSGVDLGICNNCIVRNLNISNLFVKNTSDSQGGGEGIHIRGSSDKIYNNTIHDSMIGITYNYNAGATETNGEVYGNTVYHANQGISVGDTGSGAVFNGLLIHNNECYDAAIWDDLVANEFHHNCVIVFITNDNSKISGLQIYDNYFHGDMGARETGHIFLDDEGNGSMGAYDGTLIYNNILADSSSVNGPSNGFIITKANGGSPNVSIYNNTQYFATNVGSRCIMDQGAILTVMNNSATGCGMGIYLSAGSVAKSDYNNWYSVPQMNGYSSLAAWTSGTGFDAHSTTSNPNLNTKTFVPASNSSLASAGMNLTNISVAALDSDKNGTIRASTGSWDIGAIAMGGSQSSNPPDPPSSLVAIVN